MKKEKRSNWRILTYLIEKKYYFKKDVSREIRRIAQSNKNYVMIGGVIYLKDTK